MWEMHRRWRESKMDDDPNHLASHFYFDDAKSGFKKATDKGKIKAAFDKVNRVVQFRPMKNPILVTKETGSNHGSVVMNVDKTAVTSFTVKTRSGFETTLAH